ncbi:NAD(P)/FAD-dependent oxidoreductase [Tateyamaria armeniaca]|uniref:NAD(P)/FAD-dependent oxidoreductase n=1 Tax=Tateyamaria armeniaca TaxID=2518930 RepID=A0ABW8UX73_9RHOB
MRVTRLPRDPGPAGWNRLLPDPDPPSRLEGNITADWLVIGAGFAGLAAAHRLAKHVSGARIVVLDAVRVGDGPAGRNSGFMIDLPHDLTSHDYGGALDSDLAQTQDNRAGIAHAAEMAQEYDLSAEAFAMSGKINAAASAKGAAHNRDFARHLAAMGEAHEMLDSAQMRDLTGIDYYESGLFTPGTAMIQPAMFVRGVARGLRSNRITIHENSPVIALERRGDWVARTPKGQITAPRVILAVNGHLGSFGHMQGRLMHVFTYASMTRPLGADEVARLGGNPVWGVTPADPMGTTVRRISGTGGDRIVIRNRFTFAPKMEVNAARIARIGRDHDRAFARRFPQLEGVSMEYRWGGRLCLSRNSVQVIAELDEGLYSACCQNGLGTAKGTFAGGLAADLSMGIASPALDRALAADPPTRLPPAPIAGIGANMHIRWAEMRAGKEL